MVVVSSFQDVFEESAKTGNLNLPNYKENALKLEFGICKANKTNIEFSSEPPLPFAASELFHSRVVNWRRLTAVDEDCKPVYEVTFDIKGSNFNYKPGDSIGIVPRNNKSEVDFILNHLNLTTTADLCYSLSIDTSQNGTKTKLPAHIPVSSTIRHVLTHCMDLRAVMKKLFLLALSRHTKDDNERQALEYLCSKEGSHAYIKHILNTNTCLLDLLGIFKSCNPPIEVLIQHLPRLLPRPYSIVNSPIKNPDIVKICFSVIDIGNSRKGLTTGWLENIILNNEHLKENGLCSEEEKFLVDALKNLSVTETQTIPIYLRKNMNCFEFPEKLNSPVILIGPGTGVAPYIGFLEQMQYSKTQGQNDFPEVWLFFGCRHPKLDFIYQQELNDFIDNKILTRLETSFSRYENFETKYVQDALMNNSEDIVSLIKAGSRIYVCGDVKKMAVQVRDTIVKCLVQHDGRTIEETEDLICDLQKNKMYIVDIWN